jgi:hypothetical protein
MSFFQCAYGVSELGICILYAFSFIVDMDTLTLQAVILIFWCVCVNLRSLSIKIGFVCLGTFSRDVVPFLIKFPV